MGKACSSCGAEIDSPELPEGEDEMCDNCKMDEDKDSDMNGGMGEDMDLGMGDGDDM